jgi:hypothetical protein
MGGYLFLPGFSSLYDAIHEWMMGRMDGWMEKASQKTTKRPLLYVIKSQGKFYHVRKQHVYIARVLLLHVHL